MQTWLDLGGSQHFQVDLEPNRESHRDDHHRRSWGNLSLRKLKMEKHVFFHED